MNHINAIELLHKGSTHLRSKLRLWNGKKYRRDYYSSAVSYSILKIQRSLLISQMLKSFQQTRRSVSIANIIHSWNFCDNNRRNRFPLGHYNDCKKKRFSSCGFSNARFCVGLDTAPTISSKFRNVFYLQNAFIGQCASQQISSYHRFTSTGKDSSKNLRIDSMVAHNWEGKSNCLRSYTLF